MNKIIKFINTRAWSNMDSPSAPAPAGQKNIPEWYRDADRFAKMPNGDHYVDPMNQGKIPTWKACPAIYDIMTTGYVFRTPCDIEFKKVNGKITGKTLDSSYADFLHSRDPMPQFVVPHGYDEVHFAWYSDWTVSTPEGYSVLYSQPFGRYDLPFMTTSGIIDNDKVAMSGTMPFFIQKGWEGIIPAGTPYSQLIPFKREDWDSEWDKQSPLDIHKKKMDANRTFRVKDGGVYLKSFWSKRKYS